MRPPFKVQAEIEDAGILRAEPPGAARAEQTGDHECQDSPVGCNFPLPLMPPKHKVLALVLSHDAVNQAGEALLVEDTRSSKTPLSLKEV